MAGKLRATSLKSLHNVFDFKPAVQSKEAAPFPEYGLAYPAPGPPVMKVDPKKGNTYPSKQLTPEAEKLAKARREVQADMDRNGFEPMFDPAKRYDVEAANYPQNFDTSTIVPAKESTRAKDLEKFGSDDARKRLREGYERGMQIPGSIDWYLMGQLEDAFVKRLGPVEGRKAFAEKFATSMAATTGGATPRDNLMMATYGNFLRERGLPYVETHQMPYPIADRKGNMRQHQALMDAGGFDTLGNLGANPKRHDFAFDFLGHREAVIDDQMMNGMIPGLGMPPKGKYGLVQGIVDEEAARAKADDPRMFQEVGWHGFKQEKTPDFVEGTPMIGEVNQAIERTKRLTGKSPDEVLERGIIKSQMPVYSTANPAALAGTDQGDNSPSAPSADDGYKAEPIAPGTSLKDLGMPEFSEAPKRPYAKIQLPGIFEGGADVDMQNHKVLGGGRVKGLPPGFSVGDDGIIRDPLGDPAEIVQPPRGQILSDIANAMMPGGPAGAAIKAVAGGAHGGSTALGVGPQLGGRLTQAERSIPGKPDTVKIPGEGTVAAAPIKELQDAAGSYMAKAGRPGEHNIEQFKALDEDKARRIAEAYEAMQHAPNDPAVKRAYDAMIEETMGQYRVLKDLGIEFKANPPGHDPYAASPAMGYADLVKNGRLSFFPTEQGFGTLGSIADNPLLKRVGPIGDLKDATANDAFRVVHDAFGHFAPGNPFFRAPGEERAWQAHKRMYSPEAAPAMTAETRGQNSWLNYGPHGAKNRNATSADTVFADQKSGLLPSWTMIPAMAATAGLGGTLATLGEDE